jgi:hypothetical protein
VSHAKHAYYRLGRDYYNILYLGVYRDLLRADGDYYKQITIIRVACLQHSELFPYGLNHAEHTFKKCRRKYQRTVYIAKFIDCLFFTIK